MQDKTSKNSKATFKTGLQKTVISTLLAVFQWLPQMLGKTTASEDPQPRKRRKGWNQRTSYGYSLGLAPCTHHRNMQKHCNSPSRGSDTLLISTGNQVCMSHTHKMKINKSLKTRKLTFIE